jgi:hypothetical protein
MQKHGKKKKIRNSYIIIKVSPVPWLFDKAIIGVSYESVIMGLSKCGNEWTKKENIETFWRFNFQMWEMREGRDRLRAGRGSLLEDTQQGYLDLCHPTRWPRAGTLALLRGRLCAQHITRMQPTRMHRLHVPLEFGSIYSISEGTVKKTK